MEIRNLDTKVALNNLVRHGYRHSGDYGIILNANMIDEDLFKLGRP